MNCLKSLRKNVQWLQEPLHVYLHRFMRKWKLLPSIPGCGLYFPPRRASEIPMGRGSKRRQFLRGWGQILKVFFFRDFETRIIVFIDDFTLTVIAERFFHSLPVWYSLHVYVIGSWIMPVIQVIALYFTKIIIVVFTVLWSCPISLLLTSF